MSAIVTRPLLRRYLIATGQTADELRALDALPPAVGEFDEGLDAFFAEFSSCDRALLGVLAAAEMVRPPADKSEIDAFVVGSRLALMLDLIEAAGVDPDAWEAARAS